MDTVARIKRGSAELAILAVLAEEPLHGYEIARRIAQQSGGVLRFTLASLYPMLYRLERRGWVRGNWETVPSGRRRRCYRLTAAGRREFQPMRKHWNRFFRALHQLAGVSYA
jgi:transcriptional regulator